MLNIVTVKEELASTSVSSETTVPALLVVFVTVAVTNTPSVSSTATGASLTPVTVIINVAVSVPPFPSETV